jgi:hypothetical protein
MEIFPTTKLPCFDQRFFDVRRAVYCLDLLDRHTFVKTASAGQDPLSSLITALSNMNLKVNIDLGELLKKVRANEDSPINKFARNVDGAKEDHITIASKDRQDSHYQIDISKDMVVKGNKKLHLVSIYLRDAYLGRYMIKRNFYFLGDNATDANELFEDVVKRANKIKRRYYDEKIPVNGIFGEIKSYTDGLRADVEFKEDNV